MESLEIKYRQKLDNTPTAIIRNLIDEIDWQERFVGIKGARGVGKTTLVHMSCEKRGMAYVSLEDASARAAARADADAGFSRESGDGFSLLARCRQRLLHVRVCPMSRRRSQNRQMRLRGRQNVQDVGTRVAKHALEVREERVDLEPLGRSSGQILVEIAHADDIDIGHGTERLDMDGADPAAADDSGPKALPGERGRRVIGHVTSVEESGAGPLKPMK